MSGHHHHGDHGHSHGGHSHIGQANENRIAISAVLIGVFMIVEFAGGLISGSLALIADAAHMLTDFAALALGWMAFRLARRPVDSQRTYGYDRFEVLVAFVNGLALFLIAGFIIYEAFMRLSHPENVMGSFMLVVATAGLLVNIIVFAILHGADRDNLNIRGALLHVMGDLLGSVAAIIAAIVIMTTGWMPIDPILSVLVSVIVLVSAWRLVRDAGHVLLEGAPAGLEPGDIAPHLTASIAGLADVHHVHAWSITPERRMVTLHARIAETADAGMVVRQIKAELRQKFSIGHATVEIEHGDCADGHASSGCGGAATPGAASHHDHGHHDHATGTFRHA